MPDWPWRETRYARRTRIAHLYRDALMQHAPAACCELDNTLNYYGQHWITGDYPLHIDISEPMTAKEIADWLDLGRVSAVTNRIAARGIQPVGTRNGRKTYWLRHFTDTPQHVAMP